jgi:hypothetical protein
MSAKQSLIGQIFGKLKVIEEAPPIRNSKGTSLVCWKCKCECGVIKILPAQQLIRKTTKSCGCSRISSLITHGHCKDGVVSSEYRIWQGFIKRCNNPKCKSYPDYGGRGIKVCERWMKFENFLEDMGARPKGKSLDRKNNDGHYCKENCRWATRIEQQSNTRTNRMVTVNGVTGTMSEMARKFGIGVGTLWYRLEKSKMTPEDACLKTVTKYLT